MLGIITALICVLVLLGAAVLLTKRTTNVVRFNVGERNIGGLLGATSIAAAWVWAPSLFVSAERAYVTGIPGLFWFVVPNVLCLIAFIPFARRIREQHPAGITLSSFMGQKYKSKKVQHLYQFQLGGLSVLSASVQLLAGSKMIALMTGMPFWLISISLAVVAYAFAQRSGIKSSVTADVLKIAVLFGSIILLVPMLLSATDGVATLSNGLSGVTREFSEVFSAKGMDVFFAFGLPTAIGLMAGPFGDQSFWQRAFSIKTHKLGWAFAGGAALFAIVPICMGSIGFLAAGSNFIAKDAGVVNLEFITSLLPSWVLAPFLAMVMMGLLSVVGSNLCAASSLVSDKSNNITTARLSMALLLLVAVAIANIPGLTVTHMFLFYGTLRASTLLPTVMTLLGKKLTARGVYIGIALALCIGLPVFAYGNLAGDAAFKTVGSLLAVLTSGVVAMLLSLSKKGVQAT